MRAAIYARYSSDRQKETSIEDQYRNCERYARRDGWAVVRRYRDDAISGNKSDRPQYRQLLADAEGGAFDAVIVDDLSRLSRAEFELLRVRRRLEGLRIRLIGVSDGFDSTAKGHELHASMRGMINEIFLDDLREKTHRGQTGQVLKGFSAGGKIYGYRSVPIEDPDRRDEYGRPVIVAVRREVDPAEAEVVRRIYQWYADGRSPKAIAAALNAEGVAAPRARTWASSAIRADLKRGAGILANPIYAGQILWNRTNWVRDPERDKRVRVERPRDEWVVQEDPRLRIVPPELWDVVQARLRQQQQASAKIRARLHEKARTGAGPKYLFSGLLTCGVCGGSYVIVDYRYGCGTHLNRGKAACSNSIKVPRDRIEERLLPAIKRDLFTPEGLALFKREAARHLRRRQMQSGRDHEGCASA